MTDQIPLLLRFGGSRRFVKVGAFILTLCLLFGAAPDMGQAHTAPPDPSARLPEGDAAWEYWDLNAVFATGHRVSARFMITNFGPGSQSAVVLGHVTLPNGEIVEWENGRKKSRWLLSDDHRRLDVGRSHLYLDDPTYVLDIDKEELRMTLSFAPKQKNSHDADLTLPEGYQTQTLAVAQPMTGSLWIAGIVEEETPLNGFVSLTHSWGSRSEGDLALRRFELLSMEEDNGLEMVDLTTPDGARFQWLAISEKGEMTFLTQDFEIAMEGRAPNYRSKKFWVPEKLILTGSSVNGAVHMTGVTVSQNPLKVLPQPFRFLASFKSKPRRVWGQATFELDIKTSADAPPVRKTGAGLAVVTFLNPAKKPKK